MATSPRIRSLPSVDRLLRHRGAAGLLDCYPRERVVAALRQALADRRTALRRGTASTDPNEETVLAAAAQSLAALTVPRLRPVVNATGVVLHTNLGRAVLAPQAVEALAAAGTHPTNLEYDLDTGARGERDALVEEHLCALTGAEAATVVNNNAAAVLLALNTLAEGREVIVSRGELIEIGGSFRIPDVLAKSAAILREVGTTNRTHARDYERAIGPQTALLLKVHASNYRIVGFTAEVALERLVAIGRAHQLPVMEDLGSGALVDLSVYGLPKEPVVAERVRAGADVIAFSGDKLLGGPQAGVLVGRRDPIDRMRQNPLKRALRCDKLTLAALEATLRLYRTAPDLPAVLPTLRVLTRPLAEIAATAQAAAARLRDALGPEYHVAVIDSGTEVGSGAQPTETLPSHAVAITHATIGPLDIAARFRRSNPPIIGRVHEERFLLDARCVFDPLELVPREEDRREQGARS